MKKNFVFILVSTVIFSCSTSIYTATTSSTTSGKEFAKLDHRWGTEYTYADFSKGKRFIHRQLLQVPPTSYPFKLFRK